MALTGLVGRREELDRLLASARAVSTGGTARLVTLVGEPGVGKSALLAQVAQQLADRFRIVRISSTEIEKDLAWTGLHAVVESLGSDALTTIPCAQRSAIEGALGRADAGTVDSSLVAFGLAGVLRSVARTAPIALLVDDLHWLDRSSDAALAFAVRTTANDPVVTIAAQRLGTTVTVAAGRALPEERCDVLEIPGLSPAALHRLLAERFELVLGRPDLIRLHDMTRGNPLHALAVGRSLATGRSLADALSEVTLRGAVASRVRQIPDDAMAVLRPASLLRRPTVADAIAAARRTAHLERPEEALDDAERLGVVTVRGDVIEFEHPLVRAAIADAIPTHQRRTLATVLASLAAEDDQRIALRLEAATGTDETLAHDLLAAAERAATRGALPEAAELASRSAVVTPIADGARRADRLVRAAELSSAAGDRSRPLELVAEAERCALSPEHRFRLHVVRIMTLANGSDLRAAIRAAELANVELADRPRDRARILDLLAQATSFDDFARAAVIAEEAVELARSTGDPSVGRLELLSARLAVITGETVDLDRLAGPSDDLLAMAFAGDLLTWSDRHERSIELHTRVLEAARATGVVDREMCAHDQLADTYLRLGRWADAERHLLEWLDLNQVIGGPAAGPRFGDLAVVHAHRGDVDQARQLIERALTGDRSPSEELHVDARACTVGVAIGDWASAAEHGRRARRRAHELGYRDVGALPFHADLAEALANLRETAEARAVAAELATVAAARRLGLRIATAERASALVLAAEGDLVGALDHAERSLAQMTEPQLAASASPFEAARSELVTGSLLRRAGRRSAAAERLGSAAAGFERLGAAGWAAKSELELQRLGATRRSGSTALTPTERQIGELVRAGRSNAEIAAQLSVSVRTVESNLTRAYRKLGVKSRTELAARLRSETG